MKILTLSLLATPLLFGLTVGCNGEEDLGSSSGALSQACGASTIVPDVTSVGTLSYASGSTYGASGCWQAVVAEIRKIAAEVTQVDAKNGKISVSYADTDLTTAASCADSSVAGYVFKRSGTAWTAVDFQSSTGVWNGSGCFKPYIKFDGPSDLVAGQDYRVAVSARRVQSNVTRKLTINTVAAVPPQ